MATSKKAGGADVADGPVRKSSEQRAADQRLTDAYAEEGRRDELLTGDELTELEPIGRTTGAAKQRAKKPPRP